MENLLVPYEAIRSLAAERVLVLAPHPDDEVFGCGGAVMRHVAGGAAVQVVIVTDGAYGAESGDQASNICAERRHESLNAASVMGYGAPLFWGLPDRGLEYGEALVVRIVDAMNSHIPDLVYAPSIWEMHPDHRVLGMAAVEAVRRYGGGVRLAMYEVGMPLRPNLLLDISDLVERKQSAMDCFVSQLKIQAYDQQISALDRFRSYTLPREVVAAEAYFLVDAQALQNEFPWIYASEYQRQRALGLPFTGHDRPLVSVIVRSASRQRLSETLDSVALQTYPNVEVIVVNAQGMGHEDLDLGGWCGRFPLRIVGGDGVLPSGRAANLGLENANGDLLIFIDDGLFMPDHLAKLVQASIEGEERAVYSGVRLEDKYGSTIRILDEPWVLARLIETDFFPLEAVLFGRSLILAGCRFSESLADFEEWDFWLQISRHTAFRHVPGVSAVSFATFGLGDNSAEVADEKCLSSKAAIYEKWLGRFSPREWAETVCWFEAERDHLADMVSKKTEELCIIEKTLAEREQEIALLRNQMVENDIYSTNLQQSIMALTGSTSWRITAPLRFAARLWRGK